MAIPSEPLKITFTSTAWRDWFMDTRFPDRTGTDVPGFYRLPDGRSLGVRGDELTIYAAAPAAEEEDAA